MSFHNRQKPPKIKRRARTCMHVSKPLLKYNFRSAKRYVIQLILHQHRNNWWKNFLTQWNQPRHLLALLHSPIQYVDLQAASKNSGQTSFNSWQQTNPNSTTAFLWKSRKHREPKSWNHISETGRTFEKRKNKHIRSTEKIWEKFKINVSFNSRSFTSRRKLLNETAMTTWRALE